MTQPRPARVELASRASVQMRIAHALARRTVRPGLDGLAQITRRVPALQRPVLRLTTGVEVVARPMVAIRGTSRRPISFDNFRAEWLWQDGDGGPDDPERGAILYCHGGGFLFGGLHSHRRLTSRLARAAGLPVLSIDYRQLPDARIPDAMDDAMTAYLHLLNRGFPPERIMLAGDSAGGGLVFMLALAAQAAGLPLPAGIMAIAPLADYDLEARHGHPNDRTDAFLSAFSIATAVKAGFAPDHLSTVDFTADGVVEAACSPVNHDFTGLPPVFIQVSNTEILLPDAERLTAQCAAAGVPCTLQIWDGALHVFPAFADLIPEGLAAVEHLGRFARSLVAPVVSAVAVDVAVVPADVVAA